VVAIAQWINAIFKPFLFLFRLNIILVINKHSEQLLHILTRLSTSD